MNLTLERMRRLLLAVLAIGLVGTAADLLLLKHYEDTWQVAPLVLVGIALAVIAWSLWARRALALVALRVTMVLFIAAGGLGMFLHYESNREFQKEIDPNLEGWPLVVTVLRAKAPPALAPAAMIQLGLLGLLYTYRHPALAPADASQD